MQKYNAAIFCSTVLILAFFNACTEKSAAAKASDNPFKDSTSAQYNGFATEAEWGKSLVSNHGCIGCHTPRKSTPQGIVPDSALLLSGHPGQMPHPDIDRKMVETKRLTVSSEEANAWVGKWGISYAANLTPMPRVSATGK